MTNAALRAEERRDLKSQLGNLGDDGDEILFQDTSPRRRTEPVYSMETGEEVFVLRYHLDEIMAKRLPDGSPMFTARRELAPEYRLGRAKCFMAKNAPERDVLTELGIHKTCPAEHLANNFAKQVHAEHKHKTEWRTYQEYLSGEERQADRDRQQAQIDAMLEVARGSRPVAASKPKSAVTASEHICMQCGFGAKSLFGLRAHQRKHGEAGGGDS